MGVGVGDG